MANKKKSRAWGWLFLLLLIAAGAGGAWWYWKKPREETIQFQTAKVSKGELTQMVTASGTLNPVVTVQVGSQISGQIKKLNADFNSKVNAGDVVAEIDPATYQTRLLQNEADLANAQAQLQLAEVNTRRAAELVKSKLISQSEYDTAVANLAEAKAQVQTREAQVSSTKVDLARCTIYAPINGIVIDRKVDVGQTVAASLNAPVLFLLANDLTKMQINASVAEADVGGVTESQNVKFTVDAFPGREFTGKVTQVRNSPIIVQNVVSYDTIIEVNNTDGKLKPGMTANVQVIVAQKKDALRVPNSAMRFRPPETFMAKRKPAAGGGAGSALAQGAGDVPSTPEGVIEKIRQLRERGELMSENLRKVQEEMMQKGQIKPEQLGLPSGEAGSEGGPSRFSRTGGSGGPGSRGGGSRFGGSGSGGGSRRPAGSGDRQLVRTVYVLAQGVNASIPGPDDVKSVQIKTGISDGIYTEVVEGLKDGDVLLTGLQLSTASDSSKPTNPFAGSRSRFGGPPPGR